MDSSENKKFTAADIARYHTGKMPAEERNALEKAALDDPFLADALEGYGFDSAPAAALAALQQRLDEKTHPNRPANVIRLYRVLSAVAMLVVLGGTGWFAWKAFEYANQGRSVARQGERPKVTTQVVPPATDSMNSTLPDTANNAQLPPAFTTATADTNSMQARESVPLMPEPELTAASGMDLQEVTVQKSTARDAANDSLRVASTSVPESTLSAQPMRVMQGFEGGSDSARVDRYAKAPGKDTITDFNVTLKAQKMEPPNVVVVGRGRAEGTAKYPHVIIDTLEPAEGYTNFDDYVAANIKMPEEVPDKTTGGEVQLSFDVDENGQPVNITVVKSLCSKCNQEAIRLLKEGPKWKKQKNKKGKITIRF